MKYESEILLITFEGVTKRVSVTTSLELNEAKWVWWLVRHHRFLVCVFRQFNMCSMQLTSDNEENRSPQRLTNFFPSKRIKKTSDTLRLTVCLRLSAVFVSIHCCHIPIDSWWFYWIICQLNYLYAINCYCGL